MPPLFRAVIKRLPHGFAIVAAFSGSLVAQGEADPMALRAESLMVEAMGGRSAWESSRFFDFVWAVQRGDGPANERHHVWDRWTGRYKLEARVGDGRPMVAVFNANTKQGKIWLDGNELTGDSAATWLDRAHAMYINDTYWFLMPFKWRDPGVNLTHRGTTTSDDGRTLEIVRLTFGNVGRTPRNMYDVYIDVETHTISWWEYYRDRDDTEPALRARWESWERRGPIKVSLNRPFMSANRVSIFFPRVVISTELDESAFSPPSSGR